MTAPSIDYALNDHIHNKPPEWRSEFASNWYTVTGTLDSLREQVSAGKAFVPAAMLSSHRTTAAFKYSDIAVVDVDYGLTIEQFKAHPLCAQAAWVYTTANHNPEVDAERFRVIFRLPERVNNPDIYKAAVTLLSRSLGGDKSCTDPCRLFYGNSSAQHPTWNPDAVLSFSFLRDAKGEASRQRRTYDPHLAEIDDLSLLRAAFVLEQVIHPTQDGERDRFIRITAAARSAGEHLFEPWVRWASTCHHGTGKNARQATESFFLSMNGSSIATLFWLASEDDPNWRDNLPTELRSSDTASMGVFGASFAGYAHEDFLYDYESGPEITDSATQNLFDPNRPWSQIATIAPPHPEIPLPAAAQDYTYSYAFDDGEADVDQLPVFTATHPGDRDNEPAQPRRGRPRREQGENEIRIIRRLLAQMYPGLRLNIATQNLEYGPTDAPRRVDDASQMYVLISEDHDRVLPKTLVYDTAYKIGNENKYNPVRAYLDRCVSETGPCPYFKTIGSELLGLPEDSLLNPLMPDGRYLGDVVMERFMIAAVARAMDPGCICDWMPILVGSQNCGKSTFLKYLTPPETARSNNFPFYATVQQGVGYIKDRPHVLHCGWIVNFDEIERLFKRQYTEEFKNLISVPVDRSAPKYQNEKDFPRSFVLCGATNSYTFLQDPTGNRRFLPVIVKGKVYSKQSRHSKMIDLDRVQKDRDSLWAAAYAAWRNRDPHIFDTFELAHISSYMDSFFDDNPLEAQIDRILEDRFSGIHGSRYYVTLSDLFKWLELPIVQQSTMTRPITDILKRRGWTLRRVSIRGRVNRIWMRPLEEVDIPR